MSDMIERMQGLDAVGRFLRATEHFYEATTWCAWLAASGVVLAVLIAGKWIVRRRAALSNSKGGEG